MGFYLEIICSVNKNRYVDGDVVIFSCPRGYRLSGSEVSQCYYYGWDPALPICEEINYPYREGKLSEARQEGVSDCPPVPEPAYVQKMYHKSVYINGDTVEMRCDPGFIRHGSNMTTCHNGKWSSPPQCIYSQPCYNPPVIENGGLTKESEKREYAAGDVVKYQCNTGYSISGSAESLCLNGRWQTTPICTGNDCGRAKIIPHATIQDEKTNYKHADSVVYVCLPGYKLVGDSPAKCINGEWKQIPACAYLGLNSFEPVEKASRAK
ncbi:coagulation factor XIII B chain-like [Rhinophrynus dorsalis]